MGSELSLVCTEAPAPAICLPPRPRNGGEGWGEGVYTTAQHSPRLPSPSHGFAVGPSLSRFKAR